MSDLVWERDGRAWPNREASRFVRAAGITWHVQQMGSGPVLLLAHGTGSSTHSWRDLAPLLARHFTLVAPDLPGHGFTTRPNPRRLSLSGMAADLAALLDEIGVSPDLAVGHSAGAAIVCRMILDGRLDAKGAVSLNGALTGFRGVAGHLFSPLAKLLAVNPVVPRLVALTMSGRGSVQRLIQDTGSTIDEAGLAAYRRLVASPTHVGSALGMMANWDLETLERDLARLPLPLLLLVGGHDRAIPPSAAEKVRRIVPAATLKEQRGLGHLAHEEKPAETSEIIVGFGRQVGALSA